MLNHDSSHADSLGAFGALWEVAGHWLIALVAAVVVAYALLVSLEQRELEASLDGRLRTLLEQAGDRVEVALSLGIELAAIPEGQDLVEKLAATESAIVALDIFDTSGVFAASTDRASVGRPAPAEWVTAARAGERTIRSQSLRVILVPLEGSFGDTAGYIAAGYSAPRVSSQAGHWRLAVAAGFVLLCGLVYAWFEVGRMRKPLERVAAVIADPSMLQHAGLPTEIESGLAHLARTEAAIGAASDNLAAGRN